MGMNNYQMLTKTVQNMLGSEGSDAVLKMLKEKVSEGDGAAATILGQLYEEGVGVFEDIETAIEYYNYGLESGCFEAAGFLVDLFSQGEKVPQNQTRVYETYKKGAERGDVECAARLAECYLHGQGTQPDANAALEWGLRAAKAGDSYGMATVGDVYRMMLKNAGEAYHWYTKALEYEPGMLYLIQMQVYCLLDPFSYFGINRDYGNCSKAAQICKDNLDIDENGALHLFLALCYADGLGVSQDVDYAHDLVVKSVDLGNEDAKELLKGFRRSIFGTWVLQ